MNIPKLLSLPASAALLVASAHAQGIIVEQWTFDGANPETGVNGGSISTWTTTAPNTVPSAGVLGYSTPGNAPSSLFSTPIDTSVVPAVSLTISLTDMVLGDQVIFQFGEDGDGNMEVEFNEFSENAFSLDVEGGGNTLDSAIILNQADFSGSAIPLEVTTTWDFANNEISYSVTGSATASETISADLSSITSVSWFRPRGGDMANGTVLSLDTVTITAIPEPSAFVFLAGILACLPAILRRKGLRRDCSHS